MAARLGAQLRDSDLRRALSVVIRQRYRGRDFLLVPEVDIVCGLPGRIDALLVADRIGGFEIKSDVDTLQRLGRQVKAYEPVFEECTLVTVVGHVAAAEKALPPWWAIWVASGTGDVVTLENYRCGAENPVVPPRSWRVPYAASGVMLDSLIS